MTAQKAVLGETSNSVSCPFCDLADTPLVYESESVVAFRDRYPVGAGHTLVIPRRHVRTYFDASPKEQAELWQAVESVKRDLDRELQPNGYNVGFNAGEAAGQTVMHLHVHIIPRFNGDMDDPRGGVRHVIPSKGNYLRRVAALAAGGEDDPLARHVLPLFDTADEIAILAAFVQDSGLTRIGAVLRAAVDRGARVRLLTGDYLDITQSIALERLLDWQRVGAISGDQEPPSAGALETRVIEVSTLPGRTKAFHPKSWRFEARGFGVAFVGSSNLSLSALDTGIEWNLRVDRDRDSEAYQRVRDAFDTLWGSARTLDAAWIDAYSARARSAARALPPGELDVEELAPIPDPHEVQREALKSLAAARENGRRRALVVLATGLGKTWLAAFDYRQLLEETGVRPRLLFLAHRRELLRQAAHTYRRLLRALGIQARVTWFVEDESGLSGDLVFASVAKLARPEHLARLRAETFDYVVVDEVHHAAADSYRRILDAINPRFLLGLTATPDRADSLDIRGLFDDFVAFTADIPRGIAIKRLVPFHYFGLKDDIDYEHIPWRNKRFDPAALAEAAQTEARMETLWRALTGHGGRRTLLFCCSIAHAVYVRQWLRAKGMTVAAVFSAEGSDDREVALREFKAGMLDALCAIDVFNEGIDVPSIDRVVMLRPTESNVVFLQQLGRGLRADDGKGAVTVLDFVGNHAVFLQRVRTLLSLGTAAAPLNLREFLTSSATAELPEGCFVHLELEAKETLQRLFRVTGADEVERVYRELRVERGERPTAGELQRMGYLPSRIRERHGDWFSFVRNEADLAEDEVRALHVGDAFLRDLEVTDMTKCFKMVTLQSMIESDQLLEGMKLVELAQRSRAIMARSPDLLADVPEELRVDATDAKWLAYWRKNPIAAWTSRERSGRTWFRGEADRLQLELRIEAPIREAFVRLTRELVDYRLAQYRARLRQSAVREGFVCKVTWNKRDPILKLPKRDRAIPEGETDVRLPDGAVWQFRFQKEFCNVARPAGSQRNQLPDLLHRWFGPRAGQPGTAFQVRFFASPDGLWLEQVQAQVIDLAARRAIVAYPDLRAAAGHARADSPEDPEAGRVLLPIDSDDPALFAVRVSGTSMDGGKAPLRDGDWAVMRVARGQPASALEDRVVLMQVLSAPGDELSGFQIKRLSRRDGRWLLTSDNPDGPTLEPDENAIPIARLERVVRPEELAPPIGTTLDQDDLPTHFGIDELAPRIGRFGGHLFLFVDKPGLLVAQDRLRVPEIRPRAGETACALAQDGDGRWRFLGVGRATADDMWRIPDVDYGTWRRWGSGREVSRPVPEGALSRAQLVVDSLRDEPGFARADGQRARILGAAARGGLRIDGGDGGFGERTVSLVDIAWVVVAADDVTTSGGVLDEERVNRLRYLEGTPKGSTRWIDTGWAIAAWEAAKGPVRNVRS